MWVLLMYRVSAWYLLVCLSVTAVTQSVSANESVGIELMEAITRTLAHNPSLKAFGYQIDAQQGRLDQSTLRPNPELGISVENVLGSGALKGVDSAETTLSLGWVLERGKRESRVATARAGVSLVQAEEDIRRLDTVAATARLFLDSLANQERLIHMDAAVTLSEETVAAVGKRVQAGRTPKAELARAEAELARVQLAWEDVEHELLTSNHRLAAQWGKTRLDFTRVSGNIHKLPAPDSFPSMVARIDQNPDLTRYLTQQSLREAELRQVETEAKPSWRVNAGVRRLEWSNDQAFVVGITIPLAMRNRNQGRIAEAHAKLAMTDADRSTTRIQIETQLFAIYQELQHSLHRAATLRKDIIPRVEQALADTQQAYNAGRYGYFELRVVQSEVLNAQTALIEASIDAHRHVIEIERLTGTALTSLVALP